MYGQSGRCDASGAKGGGGGFLQGTTRRRGYEGYTGKRDRPIRSV